MCEENSTISLRYVAVRSFAMAVISSVMLTIGFVVSSIVLVVQIPEWFFIVLENSMGLSFDGIYNATVENGRWADNFATQLSGVIFASVMFGGFTLLIGKVGVILGLTDNPEDAFRHERHRDAIKNSVKMSVLIGVPLSIFLLAGSFFSTSLMFESGGISQSVAEQLVRSTLFIFPSITLFELSVLEFVRY